jgi:hypothetical protein
LGSIVLRNKVFQRRWMAGSNTAMRRAYVAPS